VIPTPHGTDLMEAVILGGGDEMRLTVPLVKNSRNISFAAFPLTPGSMKVVLGQYTWNRNFSEADVHKLQTFHVPINDATASNMRILSVSGQAYLGRILVNQRDATARIPIQISMNSNLWKPNPLYF